MRQMIGHFFVDPGFGGTGWAYFPRVATRRRQKPLPPEAMNVLHYDSAIKSLKDDADWVLAMRHLHSQFLCKLDDYLPAVVHIEFASLWQSAKSHASANRGDLFKLTALIGAYAAACMQVGCEIRFVRVAAWKGQLPKRVVRARIDRAWGNFAGRTGLRDHETDAVGMGLAFQGGM